MTQYNDKVERQRLRIEADKWANEVASIHGHALKSMWYDNRPHDTDGHSVLDIMYNDGRVERKLHNGETVIMGKRLTGEDLVDAYVRGQQ